MKQQTAGPHTYIVLLEQRQLIVDINDLDDDLTVCAENCQTKVMSGLGSKTDFYLRTGVLHITACGLPGSLTLIVRL